MKKTFNHRCDSESPPRNYSLPTTKLRNVSCSYCKHQFFLREFVPLRGLVPLLLECGHVICDRCAKVALHKPCPLCNMVTQFEDVAKVSLPLNMYALGLMVVSHNRPMGTEDIDDIGFSKSVQSKMKQKNSHGLCHECGIQAAIKCPQCSALFCSVCYSKIHGRALQNHSKILLSESSANDSFVVRNSCSERCKEPLGYYCENCDIAGCSHCMLRLHKKHNYSSLLSKNQELLPAFHKVHERVMESLKRVRQAQKKIQSTAQHPIKMQNADVVETAITQHFAYLHGVLQNVEREIIGTLHRQRDSRNKNIDEISTQLKELEDRLHSALLITASVEDNLDKVDIQQVIQKLQELADFPCHLVINSAPDDQEIRFHIDDSIVDAMKKHCNVQVPAVSSFSLQRTELLPDDYEMEPLTEEISIQRFRNNASSSRMSSMSTESLTPKKSDNLPAVGTSEMVKITHVINPSCFYVQLIQNQHRIVELNKGLSVLANTSGVIPTEVTLNALYIVQACKDRGWYRGRVVEKKTEANDNEKYNVLFVDYGVVETNVPLSRMRNIVPQFSMIPILSLRCTLHDVVPNHGKWQPDATLAFKKLVCTNTMVSMFIKMTTGDTYYVELSVISSHDLGLISVKDSLTYMKYATCVTPNKLMKINPDSTKTYYKEQLELECYTNVQILFVKSPSCIYVQKTHANRSFFCTLVREMTEYYERNVHSSDIIPVPYKDLPCAARGVDGLWHRGLVREVTENTVTVFYVDLGYTLVLDYNAIRSLSKKYMTCRTQAIKVSLRNIKPIYEEKKQWAEETNECLKSLLMNTKLFRIVAFEVIGDTYSVAMYTLDKNTSVSYILIKKGLVKSTGMSYSSEANRETNNKRQKKHKPKKSSPPITAAVATPEESYDMMNTSVKNKSIMEDNVEDPFKVSVTIHHAQSPDCIYVSDATCEQTDIDRMMGQMQEFYRKYRAAERCMWQKDAVCAVFSRKNDMYCRGRIVDVKSPDKVIVFLYDMGLEEAVIMKDIQTLYPPFFKIPTYVFKIKLNGILPCGGSATWPSLSCEELRSMIENNHTCKFYISKLEEENVEDGAIPVELWIKQVKMDGPLAPTRIEINSVNRMLVEKGVALPVKEYAKKRDRILAVELKRQLIKKLERLSKCDINVKWHRIGEDLNGLEIDKDESHTLLRYSDSNSDASEDYSSEQIFDNIPSLPKLTTWLPPDIIVEDSFIAMPTYIDYSGFLHLHSKSQNTVTLRKIEAKLEKLYKNATIESCDTVWAAGDMCIAQYHANQKWYRGKVVKVLENEVIEVQFVDYGNIEECGVGTLKKKVVLENIPIQCTKCLIYGLKPGHENGKWRTEDLDKIHSLVIEQECEVTILDRTREYLVISVTLLPNKYCPKKTDLISFLTNQCAMNIKRDRGSVISEKSASSSDTRDVIIESSRSFASDDEIALKDPVVTGSSPLLLNSNPDDNKYDDSSAVIDVDNICWHSAKKEVVSSTPYVVSEEDLLNYRRIDIPEDVEFIEIELCVSRNACEFEAHLKENVHSTILNSYHDRFEDLMAQLQESAYKQPNVTRFVPNTPCCARFTDGIWYRCLIEEVDSIPGTEHIEIKLLFVDYGNDEYRTINPLQNEVFVLKKEWMELPAMALKCKLWNIEVAPDVDDHILLPQLETMYNKRVIAAVKESDPIYTSVELYEDESCTELLYSSLIAEGLFKLKSATN